eukprot:5884378-Pyramimonas_sp.AAC.1
MRLGMQVFGPPPSSRRPGLRSQKEQGAVAFLGLFRRLAKFSPIFAPGARRRGLLRNLPFGVLL